MKKKVIRLTALLLACLMALSLAACGTEKPSETGGSPAESKAPAESKTPTESKAPAESGAPSGTDTLNVALTADSGTLSPCIMTGSAFQAVFCVMEPLWDVTIDNEIIYVLCDTIEEVSDTQFTIRLKEGIKFSNGNPLTASDVVFSMKLHAEAGATGGPRVQTVDIAATSAIDELTLDLRLLAPTIANYSVLSQMLVYDEESYNADEAALHPIGTGPYICTDYVPNSEIKLERNESYWGAPSDAKYVNFKVLSETAQRVNALETGLVDLAPIATTDYDYVSGVKNLGLVGQYTGNYVGINFNLSESSAFYHNAEARKAVAHAVNRQAILDTVYLGHGELMHASVPLYCFDYEDRFNDMDDIYKVGYNVERATELAKSSGLAEKHIKIMTDGTNDAIRAAEMIQGMLSAASVSAEINNYDPATVWQMIYDPAAVWDMTVGVGMAPNRRVGDLLLNGVRYNSSMVIPDAFENNVEYLELAPLCMSLQDPKELSDMLYDMLGRYEDQVLSYSMFDVLHYHAYTGNVDPASLLFSLGTSGIRIQDVKLA